MPIGLLHTKISRPILAKGWIQRQSLFERLSQSLSSECHLTLVSAPAGYGKSTLVSAWLAQVNQPASWLSLDERDNDLRRFLLYFIAATQRLELEFCAELFAVLQGGEVPPTDIVVTTLVNEMLNWNATRMIVLDDFHFIQSDEVLEFVSQLLAHQPPALHLMILTREDPPIPLGRLRVRGQMTEIRAADLCFSTHESQDFFKQVIGLELSPQDIQSLTKRTEGWAAGLQLAGLLLKEVDDPTTLVRSFSGEHRFVLSYLTEEVLKHQAPELQEFLLQTSILAQLCGDLCDAVTGSSNSDQRLEALFAANLFLILLDDVGRWYRYHHLFAEMLQAQLRRSQPQLLPELHRRASQWFEDREMPIYSIEHALAAGDQRRLMGLLEKHSWRLLTQGYSQTFLKWAELLPQEVRNLSPKLNTRIAWGKVLHGEYQQAANYLATAQLAVENLPPDETETRELQTDVLILGSFVSQGQGKVEQALMLAEQAKSIAPSEDVRLRGSVSLVFGVASRMMGRYDEAIEALHEAIVAAHAIEDHVTAVVAVAHLSLIWLQLGKLRRLAEMAEFAIERAEKISRIAPLMIGSAHAVLGQVYYEWNQIEKARAVLEHAIRLATLSNQPSSLIYSKIAMARLCQGEGDLEAAARCLREAYEILELGGPSWARLDWVGQQVNLLVAQRKLAEAESLLNSTGIAADSVVTYRTDVIHLAWLRWMIAARRSEAFGLAERIAQSAEAAGRNGTLLHALVLGAKAGGGTEWLERARQLAAPEGYQRIFFDERCDEKSLTSQNLIEPIHERELEVLGMLAEGMTYAEIAKRLVMSINTVRYHVKGIYRKLGVQKQTQAVERGREIGLI